MKLRHHGLVFLSPLFFCFCADGPTTYKGDLTYTIERLYTGLTTNHLIFQIENPDDFQVRVSIDDVSCNKLLASWIDAEESMNFELTYTLEKTYTANIEIQRKNKTPYISDSIKWYYSTSKPSIPVVAFREKAAASSGIVHFLLIGSIATLTKEVWISGDLQDSPEGHWEPIPEALSLEKIVSAADGTKSFQIKYRNLYGNESDLFSLSILKKSTGPVQCEVQLPSSISNTATLRFDVTATNEGSMQGFVDGNVVDGPVHFSQFSLPLTSSFKLTPALGAKTLRFTFKDLAENPCDPIEKTITYDPNYEAYSYMFDGNSQSWALSSLVSILPTYDHLPSDEIQMKIEGDVAASSSTFQWIPFADSITIGLAPTTGLREVTLQFKDIKTGELTEKLSKQIYLKPDLSYRSGFVFLSQIPTLSHLNISGCVQSYVEKPPAQNYPCTPSGTSISVEYFFNDGTLVTKSILN
jgi:hypothetical protein